MTNMIQGASYNVKTGRSAKAVVQEVIDLMEGHEIGAPAVDILFLQEMPTSVKAVKKASRGRGRLSDYHVFCYPEAGEAGRETAIVVRKSMPAKFPRLQDITEIEYERQRHSKKSTLHPGRKQVSVKAGFVGRAMSVHLPQGPYTKKWPLRSKAMRDSMRHIRKLARRWRKNSWVMVGDWNVGPESPLARKLIEVSGGEAHFVKDDARIDWVLAKGVRISNVHRIDFGKSDHKPLLFEIHELPEA